MCTINDLHLLLIIYTGIITTTRSFDYDWPYFEHMFLLTAFVSSPSGQISDTAVIFINITDVNDNAPQYNIVEDVQSSNVNLTTAHQEETLYIINISENATVGIIGFSVNGWDIDSGLNGEVEYYIYNPGNYKLQLFTLHNN